MKTTTDNKSNLSATDSLDSKVISEPSFLDRFYSKLIVDTLVSMKKGYLFLTLPDGSKVDNGSHDRSFTCHIEINSYNFFRRCIAFGAIGFAESYMEAEWSSDNLVDVIRWFILNGDQSTVMDGSERKKLFLDLFNVFNRIGHRLRDNTRAMSKKNIEEHYDLSNELFKLFLDESMTYSSAIFSPGDYDLARAQVRKYESLARALYLESGDHVLEIGCGWGGFACYLARHYGVRVTGITISREQFEFARQRVIDEGLADRVDIQFSDFRDLKGEFDKIASIEMVEALGDAQVDVFFARCRELLKRDGVLAIQMIMSPDSRYEELKGGVDFIQKHIFPGSLLLSMERVIRATSSTSNLHLIGMKEFPESYAKTLSQWSSNFQANLDKVRELGFSEQFIRKWIYYFAYCEAAFDMRQISVVQFAMTGPNNLKLREKRSL